MNKTLPVLLLLSVLAASMVRQPSVQKTIAQSGEPSYWVSRFQHKREFGNGTVKMVFHLGPQVFWDETEWCELKFGDYYATDGYYLLENSHITAHVYDWYTVFYDPDNERVCVDDERWIVEVYAKGWREVDLYSPTLSYMNNETHLTVTRTFDCPEAVFNVTYILSKASFLKHDVVFVSRVSGSNQFRAVMKPTPPAPSTDIMFGMSVMFSIIIAAIVGYGYLRRH